jgi:predicted regulator of Ras-like GTPase activity (Roadblock/LC7/MglB family)
MKPDNRGKLMNHTFAMIFSNMQSRLKNIKVLNLTTADGFSLFSHCSEDFKIEVDKLPAVTSSLTALSHAASKQILAANFESTCIETDMGLIYMVQTQYQNKDCILSVICGDEPNLGHIRFYILKLAKYLATATLSAD